MRRLAALLAFCVLSVFSASPAGADVNRIRVPATDTFFNPCAGEFVLLSGSLLFIERDQVDETGARFMRIVVSPHVTGTGLTTGQAYIARESLQEVFKTPFIAGETTEATAISTIALVTPGATPNWSFRFAFHIAITPHGKVAVSITQSSSDCVG